jgi:hypothetical protein
MKDRNYYRCLNTRLLIEAARDSAHELAIALGERLEDESWVRELESDELAARVKALEEELALQEDF